MIFYKKPSFSNSVNANMEKKGHFDKKIRFKSFQKKNFSNGLIWSSTQEPARRKLSWVGNASATLKEKTRKSTLFSMIRTCLYKNKNKRNDN